MAETTADVRRDIEMTRERMSDTIAELERKLNVSQIVKDHPWPAIGLAVGAGFLLSGTGADVKAASAAASGVAATKGASSRLGPLLDDVVARMLQGITDVLQQRADDLVDELKRAIGAPTDDSLQRQSMQHSHRQPDHQQQNFQQQNVQQHQGSHHNGPPQGSGDQHGYGSQQNYGSQGTGGRQGFSGQQNSGAQRPGSLDFRPEQSSHPQDPGETGGARGQSGMHGNDPGQGYGR